VTNACSLISGVGNGIGNSGNNDLQPATEVADAGGKIIALVFTFLPNPRICFEGRGGRERTNRTWTQTRRKISSEMSAKPTTDLDK
jgi:hypothetical protein